MTHESPNGQHGMELDAGLDILQSYGTITAGERREITVLLNSRRSETVEQISDLLLMARDLATAEDATGIANNVRSIVIKRKAIMLLEGMKIPVTALRTRTLQALLQHHDTSLSAEDIADLIGERRSTYVTVFLHLLTRLAQEVGYSVRTSTVYTDGIAHPTYRLVRRGGWQESTSVAS